jgi:glycosyltransferase involved in cell wall biosynthesis
VTGAPPSFAADPGPRATAVPSTRTAVGFVQYGLGRTPGGLARYASELSRGLEAAGVPLFPLAAGARRVPRGAGLPGAGRLPALLTLGQLEIGVVARRHRLALVHDPTGSAPLGMVGLPRVVTIHDAIPYVHPEASTRLDRWIYHRWLPLIVGRLDAVITSSESSRIDLLRHLPLRPERVWVIPDGVGGLFKRPSEALITAVLERHRLERPYVLYVGSIEARKNLPRLVEAMSRLVRRHPEVRLVVVGARKGPGDALGATIAQLGLERVVRFTGFVPEAELAALYAGAVVFAYPSLYEGFGLPILEAMACGTPVVTANRSSLPEVAGDAALLVDPLDPTALADALGRVLDDQQLAERLRVAGVGRARQFQWHRAVDATIEVYESVLGRPLARMGGPGHDELPAD